jgi:hypothetical protein
VFFSFQELDLLTNSFSDLEIAEKLKISYATVYKERKFYGIKTFTQKTGLIKIQGTGELRPLGSVRGAIRKDGLNDCYFETVNSEEKAYWIGLLLADGWTTLRDGKPKEVGLACSSKDIHILEDFKKATGYSGRITEKINKRSLSKSGKSTLSTLRITSQRFTKHTIEAGVKPRKSGNISLPESSFLYPASFCRGFFDGDGSISYKNFTFICNSEVFAIELKELIAKETSHVLKIACLISPLTKKDVYRLNGYIKNRDVLEWMYYSPGPKLDRKYQKFVEFWT